VQPIKFNQCIIFGAILPPGLRRSAAPQILN
jgi:hypothetical protein